MARIHKKIVIHRPYADIVPSSIRSHPEVWPQWYVGLSAPAHVHGEGEVGTTSEHTFLVAGHPFPFTNKVVESNDDGTIAHWKATFEGAIRGWHRWTYHLVNGDTEVEVEHEYTLQAEPTVQLPDAAFVDHVIERMLDLSLANLKTMMEAPVGAA